MSSTTELPPLLGEGCERLISDAGTTALITFIAVANLGSFLLAAGIFLATARRAVREKARLAEYWQYFEEEEEEYRRQQRMLMGRSGTGANVRAKSTANQVESEFRKRGSGDSGNNDAANGAGGEGGDDWSEMYDVVPAAPPPPPVKSPHTRRFVSRTSRAGLMICDPIAEEAETCASDDERRPSRRPTLLHQHSAMDMRLHKRHDYSRANSVASNRLGVPHNGHVGGNLHRTHSQELVDAMERFLFTTDNVDEVFRRSNSAISLLAMDEKRRRSSVSSLAFSANANSGASPSSTSSRHKKMSLNLLENVIAPSAASASTQELDNEFTRINLDSPMPSRRRSQPLLLSSLSAIADPAAMFKSHSARTSPFMQKRDSSDGKMNGGGGALTPPVETLKKRKKSSKIIEAALASIGLIQPSVSEGGLLSVPERNCMTVGAVPSAESAANDRRESCITLFDEEPPPHASNDQKIPEVRISVDSEERQPQRKRRSGAGAAAGMANNPPP